MNKTDQNGPGRDDERQKIAPQQTSGFGAEKDVFDMSAPFLPPPPESTDELPLPAWAQEMIARVEAANIERQAEPTRRTTIQPDGADEEPVFLTSEAAKQQESSGPFVQPSLWDDLDVDAAGEAPVELIVEAASMEALAPRTPEAAVVPSSLKPPVEVVSEQARPVEAEAIESTSAAETVIETQAAEAQAAEKTEPAGLDMPAWLSETSAGDEELQAIEEEPLQSASGSETVVETPAAGKTTPVGFNMPAWLSEASVGDEEQPFEAEAVQSASGIEAVVDASGRKDPDSRFRHAGVVE